MNILIATTNQGKFREIMSYFQTLPYTFLSLADLSYEIVPPEETEETIEGNAILKAKYYAHRTGMLTLAEDSGLFIDALQGWPGVISARIGDSSDVRTQAVLQKMSAVSVLERGATFRAVLALYHPETKELFLSEGASSGMIAEKLNEEIGNGFGYDPIFYIPEKEKTYSQMTEVEKNGVSHRGKALNRMKFFIQKQYGTKHIVVPYSLIIKDGKLLMSLRNDPFRPEHHEKWEFPGGSVEYGESLEESVIRETKEETGFEVEILAQLKYIHVERQTFPNGFSYQVYLIPFVCKVVGGDGIPRDEESLKTDWFELDQVLAQNLVAGNDHMITQILPELKEVISNIILC